MSSNRAGRRLVLAVLVAALLALGWWATRRIDDGPVVARREPPGIMGTRCSLIVVLPGARAHRAERALAAAENELRRLEAMFSTWIDASELSGLQRAAAGEEIALSPEVREVLGRAREIHDATSGAFDVTSGPLISGWRAMARQGRLPTAAELSALRERSTWEDLELTAAGAVKRRSTLALDVDGIAKGYAIDRALEVLRDAGALGGMVEVGGDLRVFGRAPDERGWRVGIHDPSGADNNALLGDLRIADRAVCTSGGYARFVEIDGTRFSHILDPRTGLPVDEVVSVTVVAGDAATADAWATALTVLGAAGLESLEAGVEALVVFTDDGGLRRVASPGFPEIDEAAVSASQSG